jgi:tRNA U34 2-thiouridine synthase MnmA/TrmU
VLCNTFIKFGIFKKWALENGYEAVASGHYAQIVDGHIARGVDPTKDQSYFLWQLIPKAASCPIPYRRPEPGAGGPANQIIQAVG